VACGIDMTLTDVAVAHHLNGDVDHDLDADDVAIAPTISNQSRPRPAIPAESAPDKRSPRRRLPPPADGPPSAQHPCPAFWGFVPACVLPA